MELCIKTIGKNRVKKGIFRGFNPCFNGTMYKNPRIWTTSSMVAIVSILVLMELCIKTNVVGTGKINWDGFNPCFNGTMYKNMGKSLNYLIVRLFQSLF